MGKRFHDVRLLQANKNLIVKGIDISKYAIESSMKEIKYHVSVGIAKELNFDDNEFDLVISINTVHNLEYDECEELWKK